MSAPLRLLSWNVNGLRALARKGVERRGAPGARPLAAWLEESGADVIGLQEARATAAQVPAELAPALASGPGADLLARGPFHHHLVAAARPGYSGVSLLSRARPDHVETALGDPAMDAEGRLQLARFGSLWVANVYFPNGNGKDRDNSRIPFKLAFYARLLERLEAVRRDSPDVVVMGDFNTAPEAIDLARPKANETTSGFCPEERAELARWFAHGWVDTFRALHPGRAQYSWWSQRFGVREKNIGWRIDHVLVTRPLMARVRRAFVDDDVLGSDHCPVGVELER